MVLSILQLAVLFLLLVSLLEVGPGTKDSHSWDPTRAREHAAPVCFASDVGKDLRSKLVKDLAQSSRVRWSLKTGFQIPHFWH